MQETDLACKVGLRKYRWTKKPFGVSVAPEEFQTGMFAVHDNIIVWGKGNEEAEASEDHDRP